MNNDPESFYEALARGPERHDLTEQLRELVSVCLVGSKLAAKALKVGNKERLRHAIDLIESGAQALSMMLEEAERSHARFGDEGGEDPE